MLVVTALGGNALLRRGEAMTAENQRKNVRIACEALAPIASDHQLVIGHGNRPQVGLQSLQQSAYAKVEPYPFDVLGAETEGMIGYMIEQELGNLLPFERPFATLLTMIEVDPEDPAFKDPTKFIGPIYDEADAGRLATELDRGTVLEPALLALAAGEDVHLGVVAEVEAARHLSVQLQVVLLTTAGLGTSAASVVPASESMVVLTIAVEASSVLRRRILYFHLIWTRPGGEPGSPMTSAIRSPRTG